MIDSPEEVQIYEPIMVAPDGSVTTGLTTGIRYIKENRLLPRGFDKAGASDDIAVYGRAAEDVDFVGGGDRVRYRARLGGAPGPYRVVATLWYQPISFRWANNLRPYDAVETNRFLRYFDEMSEYSAVALARTETVVQ